MFLIIDQIFVCMYMSGLCTKKAPIIPIMSIVPRQIANGCDV